MIVLSFWRCDALLRARSSLCFSRNARSWAFFLAICFCFRVRWEVAPIRTLPRQSLAPVRSAVESISAARSGSSSAGGSSMSLSTWAKNSFLFPGCWSARVFHAYHRGHLRGVWTPPMPRECCGHREVIFSRCESVLHYVCTIVRTIHSARYAYHIYYGVSIHAVLSVRIVRCLLVSISIVEAHEAHLLQESKRSGT